MGTKLVSNNYINSTRNDNYPSQVNKVFPDAEGYPNIANMWKLVRQHYKGSRLKEFIEEYIKGCTKC